MQNTEKIYVLGIDIGSTTVKIAILDSKHEVVFSDYRRHYANIQGTLAAQLSDAFEKIGEVNIIPMITGSGGLTLSKHLKSPFVQEVVGLQLHLRLLLHKQMWQ